MKDKMGGAANPGCALLSCEVCCKEIPPSEVLNAEAADYVYHFCGPSCFERFTTARVADRDELNVFQVRLRCEAAPKIGCGLRSKPVLQDLERVPGIREAWLNEAGNLIAVARTPTAAGADGADPALAVFGKHRIAAEPLHGERFVKALKEFASRSGWYRGADVDRLSKEEARTIAARFVARLRARSTLPDRQVIALEDAVTRACVDQLIRVPSQAPVARKRRLASAVLAAAREQLDAPEFAAFAEVVKLGHRPLRGER